MVRHILTSMRPRQWVKNLIILAPLVFSQNLFILQKTMLVLGGFAIFCLLSGSVYLLNDIFDRDKDKQHPSKCNRPIASGKLPVGVAAFFMVLFSIGSLVAAFLLHPLFGLFAFLYLANNLAYSTLLKHVVIVDVMQIALGFVLRVLAGAAIIEVPTTPWLLMCTILLALFLGFAKRRRELSLLNGEADNHRRVLEHYTPYFLDQMILIVTASTVMSYALYTMSPETVENFGTNKLIYTVPFVLYGIFRYLYLVHLKEGGGNPTKILLSDKPLFINVMLWLICCLLIIEGLI